MIKIAIVVGTRPEIIKMSPIVRYCEEKRLNYFIIHTGQHYSYEMDKIFFKELELPSPKYNLNVGSAVYGKQLGKMIRGIQEKLASEKPDIVLVLGDTNSTLAGTLAAHNLGIKLAHIESGLRTYELMYEEINRVLVGIYSSLLFAPTEKSRNNLLNEDIPKDRIFVTGNTIVDAVLQNLEISNRKSGILKKLNLEGGKYILLTAHRVETVDEEKHFNGVIKGIELVINEFGLPIIFPMHPRTKKNMNNMGLKMPKGVVAIDPVGYLDMLQLISNAKVVITDSGGLQEETCTLKVPCITIRECTERGETVEIGCNVLAGYDPQKILECTKQMVTKSKNWKNPYGDGNSAKKIMEIILSSFEEKK